MFLRVFNKNKRVVVKTRQFRGYLRDYKGIFTVNLRDYKGIFVMDLRDYKGILSQKGLILTGL